MRSESVRFESVRHRDLELLVCEELVVSPTFRSWLCETLALEAVSSSLIGVRDSIGGETVDVDRSREGTGVECGLEVDGERVLVVFATAFDPEASVSGSDGRFERYRTRRERALEGEWDDCLLVRLVPAEALESGECNGVPFDATITLESLRDRFAARGTDRGNYRAALVAAALDGSRQGSDALLEAYRSAVADREPDLECHLERSSPDEVDDAATRVELEAPSLAPDHRLVHAVERGSVDLLIPGAAPHLQPFAARYADELPPTTQFLESGETLVLRLSVLTPGPKSADSSVDKAADDALSAIRNLLAVSERVAERTG